MTQNYNIESEMIKRIQERKSIFTTDRNDPNYDKPIKALNKTYGKGLFRFIKDLKSMWVIRIKTVKL